ncbi:hypothetical protein [Streptomyces enissocaesilis]|uniref:Uncharacterized protein n=1 Tax=Streptomyces enissocaesilis TaxID=332589 RepID=A0ABP6K699_9ACTN
MRPVSHTALGTATTAVLPVTVVAPSAARGPLDAPAAGPVTLCWKATAGSPYVCHLT